MYLTKMYNLSLTTFSHHPLTFHEQSLRRTIQFVQQFLQREIIPTQFGHLFWKADFN